MMRDLAKRRLQIAERLFDAFEFGIWSFEEVSHWHVATCRMPEHGATPSLWGDTLRTPGRTSAQ
jgi:hypothetical protein